MKRWKYVVGIFVFFLFTGNSYASSCSVWASSNNITIGQSVTIYVKGSDLIANISSISASNGSVSGISDTWIENSTSTAKFTPSTTGKATVSVKLGPGASNSGGSAVNVGCNSVTITVNSKTTQQKPANNTKKKSSNNDLSKLAVTGYDFDFDKEKTSYSLTVPYGTEKIVIDAEKDSKEASIAGDGTQTVEEGENTFDVVVTAEDGSKKTYTLHITVDSKPIIVTLGDQEYTLVKKESDLPEIHFEKEVIQLNIEDQEIDAYRIDNISYILVGLKDAEGKVALYKFDSYKDEERKDYTLYQEFQAGESTYILLPKVEDIPKGYQKQTISIQEQKVTVYGKKDSSYYLLFALNPKSEYKGWYRYDPLENTLQRYLEEQTNTWDGLERPIYLGICAGISFFLSILIAFMKRLKKQKKDSI